MSQLFLQSSICFEIIAVILEKLHHLSNMHNPHSLALHIYYPNLLKTVSTHPSSLVEEYLIIVQHLAVNSDYSIQVSVRNMHINEQNHVKIRNQFIVFEYPSDDGVMYNRGYKLIRININLISVLYNI